MIVKKNIELLLRLLIIPSIMIVIGVIWPSFYWLWMGIIIAVFVIFYELFCLIKHKEFEPDEFTESIGCSLPLTIAVFTLAYWAYHETRYISSKGYKQHLYADCSTFKTSNIKKVCELEGFFHGCFSDCKLCTQRKEEETRIKIIQEEKEEEIEAQRERENMINKLQIAIEELKEGKSASSVAENLSEYFLDEEYLEIEDDEDGDPFIRGIPSRYQ